MTTLEAIELQKTLNGIVTEEFLSKMRNMYYDSGREIKAGDNIIYGFMVKTNETNVNQGVTFSGFVGEESYVPGKILSTTTFHPEEFGVIYEEDALMGQTKPDNIFPFLKKIQNGN